jgi:dolichyl-diphosphooligosaccharide--protein glycosyltransferase
MAAVASAAAAPAAKRGEDSQVEREIEESQWVGRSDTVLEYFVLACIFVLAFATRLFSVIRFESVIHEFDPWFNFRVTKYLVKEGFYDFHNWFDAATWYPLGRFIGGTLYPGLMWTSALIYHLLHFLHFNVDIRNVCVLLAPFMAGNTSLVVYAMTKETWNAAAGLVAALAVSIAPGYISRSVAGSYDNEAVAIFALVLTFYLWVMAVKTGSILWSGLCALGYFYMVSSWGGYIFIINLIPFHVFALLVSGRYTHRLYVAYCVFFVLGTLMSMTINFVSFIPVTSPEHMPSIGIFGLLQLYNFFFYVKSLVPPQHMRLLVIAAVLLVLSALAGVVLLSIMGYFPMLTGRFLALLGSTSNIAIVKSVSEHQPSSWTTFFFDLNALVFFMPVGIFYCFAKLTDASLFLTLYVVFAGYFASIMVRLVLVLAPAACMMGAIGISETLRKYLEIIALHTSGGFAAADAAREAGGEAGEGERERAGDGEGEGDGADENDGDGAGSRGAKAAKGGAKKEKEKEKEAPKESKPTVVPPSDAVRKRIAKRLHARASSLENTNTTEEVHPLLAVTVVFVVVAVLFFYVIHCTWVTSFAYSSPSVVLQSRNADGSRTVFDDFREAYKWLAQNTAEDAKIMSWWDYGYQITGMGNRTTIVDNNTRNNSHIATVGLAMSSTEEMAYPILRMLGVDYVLVVFGGRIGYSSDDINKFLWMVRIASGVFPRIVENDYFSAQGQYRVDREASNTMKNCLMYKMCYYRFAEEPAEYGQPPGFDRVRRTEIGKKDISFTYLEEAFTSEHWMVRIYRVLKHQERIGGVDFPRFGETKKRGKKSRAAK